MMAHCPSEHLPENLISATFQIATFSFHPWVKRVEMGEGGRKGKGVAGITQNLVEDVFVTVDCRIGLCSPLFLVCCVWPTANQWLCILALSGQDRSTGWFLHRSRIPALNWT